MANKLKLEVFSKSEEKQYIYLRHLALTYRTKLPLLSELFQIPEDELFAKIIKYNRYSYRALIFLFNYDLSDQEKAKSEAITFYISLLNAILSKNKEMQHQLINQISDANADNVVKKKNKGETFTEEDIEIIAQHQLKYALSFKTLSNIFSLDKSYLYRRIQKLIENDAELQAKYERLSAFSEDAWDLKRKQ